MTLTICIVSDSRSNRRPSPWFRARCAVNYSTPPPPRRYAVRRARGWLAAAASTTVRLYPSVLLTLEDTYPLWRVGLFWCALRGRPWGVGGVWGLVVGGLGPSEGPCVGPYALSLRLKRNRRGPKIRKSEKHHFHILNSRIIWFFWVPSKQTIRARHVCERISFGGDSIAVQTASQGLDPQRLFGSNVPP